MTCDHCVNGLRPIEWSDAKPGEPVDFAVCLCEHGQAYRRDTNEGHQTVPLWRVWCAIHQVDPSRVFLMEQVWTARELAAVGLGQAASPPARESVLLARGRKS